MKGMPRWIRRDPEHRQPASVTIAAIWQRLTNAPPLPQLETPGNGRRSAS